MWTVIHKASRFFWDISKSIIASIHIVYPKKIAERSLKSARKVSLGMRN